MSIWVAYNGYGDLIGQSDSYDGIVSLVEWQGYDVDNVFIGRVTP